MGKRSRVTLLPEAGRREGKPAVKKRTVRTVGALARQTFTHRNFVKWTRPSGHRIRARQDGQDNFSPPHGVSSGSTVLANRELPDDTANNVLQDEHKCYHHLQEHQLQANSDMM